jgi:hypothetical protein
VYSVEQVDLPADAGSGTVHFLTMQLVDGFPGGHSSFGWMDELIKEGLNWLDRWLGPPAR